MAGAQKDDATERDVKRTRQMAGVLGKRLGKVTTALDRVRVEVARARVVARGPGLNVLRDADTTLEDIAGRIRTVERNLIQCTCPPLRSPRSERASAPKPPPPPKTPEKRPKKKR